MYRDKGKIDAEVKTGSRSCWLNIVHEAKILTQKGITLRDFMRIKLGNGENTSFWEDYWIEGDSLRNRSPRLYTLESCKRITVGEKMCQPSLEFSFRRNTRGGVEQEQLGDLVTLIHDVSLSPMADRWTWALEFTVSSVRKHIDDNVNAWKVKLDALLTRDIEAFVFLCNMVRQTTIMITRWWYVSYEDFVDYDDWRTWIINMQLPSKNKMMLEAVESPKKAFATAELPESAAAYTELLMWL
nr:RNA-directed DNA polymerase, eukaryota, reverse transcriptase zinc-binding domain protein [Tanacetum cinerariifolium]